jgi:hypothetical protein
MKQAIRRANVKWFSEKQRKRRGRASPRQIVPLRLADFAKLFRYRYGMPQLPDDDSGRDDIEPVLHHLASMRQSGRRMTQWLALWASWLTLAERDKLIAEATLFARAWTADELAWRYKVTKEERTMIGLTTIGAIDQTKGQRTKRRKARDRARRAIERQRKGSIPRNVYEATSAEQLRPWVAEGISRATWYRRQRRETGLSRDTGASTA